MKKDGITTKGFFFFLFCISIRVRVRPHHTCESQPHQQNEELEVYPYVVSTEGCTRTIRWCLLRRIFYIEERW